MSLSFKQFSEALEIAQQGGECPDFIAEGPVWDKIKSMAKSAAKAATTPSDAEINKITQAALRGDKKAQDALSDYVKSSEKREDAKKNLAHTNALSAYQKIRGAQSNLMKTAAEKAKQRPGDPWSDRPDTRRPGEYSGRA